MGVLIETGQIELVDLTDVRPAILILQASQPQVQIKKGDGSVNPDYTANDQIITPMLHLGQEFIGLSAYSDKIIYKIKDEELKKNNDGTLSINSNLPDNTTQIITAVIGELTYKDILYQNITDQIELTCLTSTSETNLQLIADGEAFTNNIQSIELTAQMYQAGKEVDGENYVWYKNGKIIEGKEGNKLTVLKGDVQSVAIFSCQVTYNGNTYKDEITINDFSDPYVGTIISSSGVIFTSANSLPTLTCDVYKGTSLIEDDVSYQWYIIPDSTNEPIGSDKTYEVDANQIDFSKESVTFLCRATVVETGGHNVAVDAILTLAIMGEISIKISPEVTFLPFNPAGEYTGDITNDEYKIKCSVVDSLGRVINKSNINSFEIELPKGITKESVIEDENKAEYIYTVKMTSESEVQNLKDSNTGAFTIVYNIGGTPSFSENFYFIKNIEGATLTVIDYFYARNNSATEHPEENWKGSISEANETFAPYLWTKTVISFNDGRDPLISYSVVQDGFSPARLVLQASLSRAQIQKGKDNFEPNYTPTAPQTITPHLYIGQESIDLSKKKTESDEYLIDVSYSIDGTPVDSLDEDDIEVNSEQELIIGTNLPGNTTWVITATIEKFEYNNATYTNVTDQTDLTCLTSSSEISLQLEATREFFSSEETTAITLTATLHEGEGTVTGQTFEWRKNGVVINNETGAELTVQKGDVQSVAIYSCSTQYLNNTYKDEITINDFSDPYTAMITSSTGTIFNSQSVLPTLTCKVFRGMTFINDATSYQWHIIRDTGSTFLGEQATPSEYKTKEEDFSGALNKSVTFLCHVTIDTDSVDALITLFITDFTIKISPEIITLPFYSNGVYAGDIVNDKYFIKCSIIDSLGKVLPRSKIGDDVSLSLPKDNSNSYFSVTLENENDTNAEYNYKITLNALDSYPELKDSNIGTFSFSYDVSENEEIEEEEPKITKEFHLIKNIKSSELTGAEVKYRYSNNPETNPDEAAPEGVTVSWYDNKQKAADNNSNNYPYLWTKTIYIMDNGEGTVSYSVSDRNKTIKNAEELYAIGLRGTGQVYIQDVGVSQEIELAILYNYTRDSIWQKEVPPYGADSAGKETSTERLIYVFDREHENKTVTNIEASAGEILWVKYIFTYDDGSTDTSAPVISSAIDGLRASVYDVQTKYTKSSIENIVKEMQWDNSGGKTLTSYIEQLSTNINVAINHNNELETWLRFNIDGLTLGKSNSNYNTFIDDKGFYIKHFSEGEESVIGEFDSEGLVISQIALNSGKIIMKKTINGGWSWVKS